MKFTRVGVVLSLLGMGSGCSSFLYAAGVRIKGDLLKDQYSVAITLPSTFKVDAALPGLSLLQGLTITDPVIVYSKYNYKDTDLATQIRAGLNFAGTLHFQGPLEPVQKITKLKEISLAGVIPQAGAGAQFSAQLPGDISFGPLGQAADLSIALSMEPTGLQAGVGVGNLKLTIPGLSLPALSGKLLLGATAGTIDAAIKEPIKDPFGIKGVTLEHVVVDDTVFTYAAPPVLTRFGLAGSMQLGSKEIDVAVKSALPSTFGIFGKTNELCFSDIGTFFEKIVGKKLGFEKLPPLCLRNAQLLMATQPFSVGDLTFGQGTQIIGEIELFTVKGILDIRAEKTEVSGSGELSPIKLGPLSITGGGKTGGPALALVFGTDPLIKLIAHVQLKPLLDSNADILIRGQEVSFKVKNEIKIAQDAKIVLNATAVAKDIKKPDFLFDFVFDNTLFSYIQNQVDNALKTVGKEVTGALRTAAETVQKQEVAIKALDQQIKKLEKEIEDLYDKSLLKQGAKLVEQGVKALANAGQEIGKQITNLGNQVNNSLHKIKVLGDAIDVLGKAIKELEKMINDILKAGWNLIRGKNPIEEYKKEKTKKEDEKREKEREKAAEEQHKRDLEAQKAQQIVLQQEMKKTEEKLQKIREAGVSIGARGVELLQKVQEKATKELVSDLNFELDRALESPAVFIPLVLKRVSVLLSSEKELAPAINTAFQRLLTALNEQITQSNVFEAQLDKDQQTLDTLKTSYEQSGSSDKQLQATIIKLMNSMGMTRSKSIPVVMASRETVEKLNQLLDAIEILQKATDQGVPSKKFSPTVNEGFAFVIAQVERVSALDKQLQETLDASEKALQVKNYQLHIELKQSVRELKQQYKKEADALRDKVARLRKSFGFKQ